MEVMIFELLGKIGGLSGIIVGVFFFMDKATRNERDKAVQATLDATKSHIDTLTAGQTVCEQRFNILLEKVLHLDKSA